MTPLLKDVILVVGMSYKQVILAISEVYHVFNRGVEERVVFTSKRDYLRFLETFVYYQRANVPSRFSFRKRPQAEDFLRLDNLVEIICYCLMPTHFHFLLRQIKDKGISSFLSRLTNSYTRYFNTRYRRIGPLFQGTFKAVRIENDEQLVHVSRYIHLNPVINFLVKDLNDYPYSSYLEYIKGGKGICQKDLVLSQFSTPKNYEKFVLDQQDYAKKLKAIQRLVLEGKKVSPHFTWKV